MIDFNELISNYLSRETREKKVGRYYPSECGSCLRKVWYSYKNPKEVDKELMKVFEMGNIIHGFIVEAIKSEKNPHVELIETEAPFQFREGNITVSGRIDDVVLVKLNGKKYIVEVKSTAGLKWTNEPTESHVFQLQLYLHNKKIEDGIILYIEKNTLQCKPFEVKYDEEKAQEAINRIKALHQFLVEDVMPEPEAKTKEKMQWQCKMCQYEKECGENLH